MRRMMLALVVACLGPASLLAQFGVDRTPPTVRLTAPAAGAVVSGTVTLTASATDNVRVYGVQFSIDGLALGAEDRSAPYTMTWNTAAASNAAHTIAARARDYSGNSASTSITVTVLNGPPVCKLALSSSVPATATTGVAVPFAATATASNCAGTIGYSWAFGDGGTAATQTASYAYTTAGTYPWSVTASVAGVTATRTGSINVAAAPNWVLAWSDEFDGPALDTTVWWPEDSTTQEYGGTLQAWSPANVVVSNGLLQLFSKREPLYGMQYTSGAVNTFGATAFVVGPTLQAFGPYGRFEIRAKLPKGRGLWPAIWMVENDPNNFAEIDVMEMHGDLPNKLYETSHYWTGGGSSQRVWASCSAVDAVDYSADFHTWAVEITPTSIVWYVDGVKRCGPATGGIPVKPLILLLNTSIGGNWAGSPGSTTPFPQEFDIDYVRFYVKQ